jgi:hypothetical protein
MLWPVSAGVAPFVFTGVSFPLAVQLKWPSVWTRASSFERP